MVRTGRRRSDPTAVRVSHARGGRTAAL